MKKAVFIFALLISGCSNSNLKKIYQKREELSALCEGKDFLKSRGKNYLILKTHNSTSVNTYFVYLDNGKYTFQSDTIEYAPDILSWHFERATEAHKSEICNYVKNINERLKSLVIAGFRTDFANLGEPLKLYMEDGKSVIHIPNLDKLPKHSPAYKEHLHKIEADWYYME